MRTAPLLLALIATIASVFADDDTLRDLGTNAVPGEIAKWDGGDWRLAHDNVGVDTVVAGPGLAANSSNGTTTVSVTFGSSGTNSLVARHVEFIATRPPVGAVVAWCKSLPGVPQDLPSGWVECNGQTLDDAESPLNGQTIPPMNGTNDDNKRFLRGATASGGTGGSSSHGHGTRTVEGWVEHGAASVYNSGSSHIPPYYEVVWIMRVK